MPRRAQRRFLGRHCQNFLRGRHDTAHRAKGHVVLPPENASWAELCLSGPWARLLSWKRRVDGLENTSGNPGTLKESIGPSSLGGSFGSMKMGSTHTRTERLGGGRQRRMDSTRSQEVVWGAGLRASHSPGPSEQSYPQRERNPPATPHLLRPRPSLASWLVNGLPEAPPSAREAGTACASSEPRPTFPSHRSARLIGSATQTRGKEVWAPPFLDPPSARRRGAATRGQCSYREGSPKALPRPCRRAATAWERVLGETAHTSPSWQEAEGSMNHRNQALPAQVPVAPLRQALCTRSGSFLGMAPPVAAGKQLPAREGSCLG